MYLLIFMPKNLVVTYCPFSPYQAGTLVVVGSPLNEPRACLSVPTATTMSPLPARMAFAACWIVAAPVAHALNTLMNGMPVRPTRPVRGSVQTPQLPPKAHWTSFHVTPASVNASSTASAAISYADLSPWRPKGWRPTPMIATSSI